MTPNPTDPRFPGDIPTDSDIPSPYETLPDDEIDRLIAADLAHKAQIAKDSPKP